MEVRFAVWDCAWLASYSPRPTIAAAEPIGDVRMLPSPDRIELQSLPVDEAPVVVVGAEVLPVVDVPVPPGLMASSPVGCDAPLWAVEGAFSVAVLTGAVSMLVSVAPNGFWIRESP
jgi:hypothetical protein